MGLTRNSQANMVNNVLDFIPNLKQCQVDGLVVGGDSNRVTVEENLMIFKDITEGGERGQQMLN